MEKQKKAWVTVFLLLSMMFLSAVFAVQGTLLSTMIEHYHLTAAEQGLANTMAFLGGILALVLAFALQGKWKKRMLLKAAMGVCTTGLALMGLTKGYALYVTGWFVTGFGLGLMDTLLSACMADLYTGKTAVAMMCMLHTAYGISSVFSPMGYTYLLNTALPWKRIYLIIAAAGIGLVSGALLIKKMQRIPDEEILSGVPFSWRRIFPAQREGRLMWLVASIFFHGIFLSGLNTWVNRYADGLLGSFPLPAQSCVFLGLMLSRMIMPFLPVRAERYVCTSGLLGGIALAAALLFPNGWVLRVLLVVSSLLFGALIPCVITLGCQRQKQHTLLVTTGIMLALYLGQAVSSPLIAALEAAIHLKAGMYLCALCMALCSLCCLTDTAIGNRQTRKNH